MLSFKACEVHPSYYLHTIILITMLYIYIIFSEEIFNIQELLHRKSKRHETKPMHPSSLRAFQRDQERDLKHPSLVDLISTNKTKQTNYLAS
jgi:hypothetical protein